MAVSYESISPEAFYGYEKLFFEEVCLLDTKGRKSFDTALPEPLEQIHFACVQDTVERLTEETKRLSTFQWRNCLFVPIDKSVRPNDIYEEVYDELKRRHPSLFIRSYVYVVFIKVYGEGSLDFGVDANDASYLKDDLQIYAWNTKSEVKLQGKIDLFNLLDDEQRSEMRKKGIRPMASNKVFIVSNPERELQRIQDANSDVIDAVRAYYGELDFVAQTEAKLKDVEDALDERDGARVLMEGPARSGKTIIAMSLLSKYPESKMLLMNWYFYEALKDAFKIWKKMDANEIGKLFAPDAALLRTVREKERLGSDLERFANDLELLSCEIRMREWPVDRLEDVPRWVGKHGENGVEWKLGNIRGCDEGDYVFVYTRAQNSFKIVKLTEICKKDNTANFAWVYCGQGKEQHVRRLDESEENVHKLEILRSIREALNQSKLDELRVSILKEIADAVASSEQRFFHHDRRKPEGLWVDGRTILIPAGDMLICDESQRLGAYGGINEADEIAKRPGRLFMCGDDCQRLNRKGDLGITRVMRSSSGKFATFRLPESIGIPSEIGMLMKSLLGECTAPVVNSSFELKLIFDDDLSLVSSFESDPSHKKHYAIPNSSGFYDCKYVPSIMRSACATPSCTEKCSKNCAHRFIPMLPQELAAKFKFFCSEAIMPNYALSAYELISREVESIYLKIPRSVDMGILSAPLDGEGGCRASWIKRHLYVLMTRPTAKLVVNVENRELYDFFHQVCMRAGLNIRGQSERDAHEPFSGAGEMR